MLVCKFEANVLKQIIYPHLHLQLPSSYVMFSRKAAMAHQEHPGHELQDGHEPIAVHERHRKFKFGNGTEQRAASFVELPQFLAGNDVQTC